MMKKFLVLLASLVTAVVVNAASYNWSGANVKLAPGDDVSAVTSYTIYLIDAKTISSEVLSGEIAVGNFDNLKNNDNVVAKTNGIIQPKPVSDQAGNSHTVFRWSVLGTEIVEGGEYYTIILDDSLEYYMLIENSSAGTSNPGVGSNAINFGNQIENNWAPIKPAPEPTSGLLILIGVAGLALRRKKL